MKKIGKEKSGGKKEMWVKKGNSQKVGVKKSGGKKVGLKKWAKITIKSKS